MSEAPCLLCEPDPELVFYRGALVLGLWDKVPSSGRGPRPRSLGEDHREQGIQVHLFVRKMGEVDQRAAPFTYCGDLDFLSFKGEKPITLVWQLRKRLSENLVRNLAP